MTNNGLQLGNERFALRGGRKFLECIEATIRNAFWKVGAEEGMEKLDRRNSEKNKHLRNARRSGRIARIKVDYLGERVVIIVFVGDLDFENRSLDYHVGNFAREAPATNHDATFGIDPAHLASVDEEGAVTAGDHKMCFVRIEGVWLKAGKFHAAILQDPFVRRA